MYVICWAFPILSDCFLYIHTINKFERPSLIYKLAIFSLRHKHVLAVAHVNAGTAVSFTFLFLAHGSAWLPFHGMGARIKPACNCSKPSNEPLFVYIITPCHHRTNHRVYFIQLGIGIELLSGLNSWEGGVTHRMNEWREFGTKQRTRGALIHWTEVGQPEFTWQHHHRIAYSAVCPFPAHPACLLATPDLIHDNEQNPKYIALVLYLIEAAAAAVAGWIIRFIPSATAAIVQNCQKEIVSFVVWDNIYNLL